MWKVPGLPGLCETLALKNLNHKRENISVLAEWKFPHEKEMKLLHPHRLHLGGIKIKGFSDQDFCPLLLGSGLIQEYPLGWGWR